MASYRNLDDMGRIVIPSKIRERLKWDAKTKLEIEVSKNQVIIKRSDDCCMLCGSTKNVLSDFGVCRKCAEKIYEKIAEEIE